MSSTPLPVDLPRRRADRARQVADVLRRQVLTGQYDDRPLPSGAALSAEFATTRNTVRAALDLLRAEGLVDWRPASSTTYGVRGQVLLTCCSSAPA